MFIDSLPTDDDMGDFTRLDHTKFPQSNESGACRDGDLSLLSAQVMAIKEEEAWNRRDGVAAAMLAQVLARLKEASWQFKQSKRGRGGRQRHKENQWI